MLVVMTPEQQRQYPGVDIVLRTSMVKSLSKVDYQDDPSLLTLDVLRVDSMKVGTTLSSEPLIIMAHCGVRESDITGLFITAMESISETLKPKRRDEETESQNLARLIAGVYRLGGVGAERGKRDCAENAISTRVAGLTRETEEAVRSSVDPFSGQPASVAERWVPLTRIRN